MKQVLVTGANGFIGSHLVENLLSRGHAVRCLVRKASDLRWIQGLNTELVFGDLTDGNSLKKALRGVDWVFHLGGITKALDKDTFVQINVEGTKKILETLVTLKNKPDRFIYVSSQAAVGPSQDGKPVSEKNKPEPVTEYGRSKLAAENVVFEFKNKIPVSVVRPPCVFGPRDRDVLEIFKMAKFHFFPSMADVNQSASLIFVEDLVRGLVMIADSSKAIGNTYHLVSENNIRWKDFAQEIADYLGKHLISVNIPFFVFRAVLFMQQFYSRLTGKPSILNEDKLAEFRQPAWILDGEKAKRELNFVQKWSIRDAIHKTTSWYLEYGWL